MLKKFFFFSSLAVLLLTKCFCETVPTREGTQPAAASSPASVLTLKPRMREALQRQVSREQYSSNLYLTFASYYSEKGLEGSEKFFRAQADEEAEHARIFYNFLLDRGIKFNLERVEASALMPTSPYDGFVKLMENERVVTKSIYNLYAIALEENDFATQTFLQSFLLIQVEEEKQAEDLVALLEIGPTDPGLIITFDQRLLEKLE